MARIRMIKPEFFINEFLGNVSPLARLLFAGLWCFADREGRLEDKPVRLKIQILPYDDCDVDELLDALVDEKDGVIERYEADGKRYIQILNFTKHQHCHVNEKSSNIPAPYKNHTSTIQAPDEHSASTVQEPEKPKSHTSDKKPQTRTNPSSTENSGASTILAPDKHRSNPPASTSTYTSTTTTKRTGINSIIPTGARARSKEVATLENESSGGGFSASLEEEKEPKSIEQDIRILQMAIIRKWRGQITVEPGQSACRNALEDNSLDKLLEALDRAPAALKSPTPTAALNCVVKYAENGSWGRVEAPEPEKDDRPADIRLAEDRLKYLNEVVAGDEEIYGIIRWLSRKLKLNEEQTFLRYEFLKYSLTHYQEVWVDPGE